jgi:probable O-glycosylation ligase (exosortase A-associated)
MRDWLLVTIVGILLPAIFVSPVVGAYLWAWLSMMSPHKLAFGFARNLPLAQTVAIVTLFAFLFSRNKHALPRSALLLAYISLLVWVTLTSFFAIAPVDQVLDRWVFVAKIHLMLLVTMLLIRERKHLEILIWIVTFSIVFFGVKGGIWTLLTGGGGRVWGPPGGLLNGNNELAVALVMLVPFLYYLHQMAKKVWLRWALALCMVFTSFSILGSQSRGAMIALLAMAFFLGLKGRNPVRTSVLLALAIALAINFMPETWSERMESIGDYQSDGSAMSRIWTWKTMLAAALDRPLVGAGFAADNPMVFARYAPIGPEWDAFAGRVYVAHSIYFQMLGEHGFVGLGLFVLLWLLAWRTASAVAKRAQAQPHLATWVPTLMRMSQVSMIGYAVGGAFLSLAYLDLPYYILAYVLLCDAMVRAGAAPTKARAPAGVLE